ncbi:MAG: ATP-binding protein [Firmicutes bacterium]|nr:ATP-binding protein [Bacillota bacterium]
MKVICLCGKIGVGKTTYADGLLRQKNIVRLNRDELMLRLFGQYCETHDEMTHKVFEYLKEKAVEICRAGADVVLDNGGWKKSQRQEAKEFFESNGIAVELHYVDVSKDRWEKQIAKRNKEVRQGRDSAYFVCEGLLKKCNDNFEVPTKDEIDVYVFDGKVVNK